MADTLVERITGQTRADAVPIAVNLVVSDHTLLGDGDEPAWLAGFGPISPDLAGELARRGHADAQSLTTPPLRQAEEPGSSSRWTPPHVASPTDSGCSSSSATAPVAPRGATHRSANATTSSATAPMARPAHSTARACASSATTTSKRPAGDPDRSPARQISATASRHSLPPDTSSPRLRPRRPPQAVLRRSSRGEYEFSRQLTLVLAG